MSNVRAKFACNAVIDALHNNQKVVHMNAVYGDEGENKGFCEATPCGNLSLHIDADMPAAKFFEQGKEYYLDFTQAPDGQ